MDVEKGEEGEVAGEVEDETGMDEADEATEEFGEAGAVRVKGREGADEKAFIVSEEGQLQGC